MHKIFSIMMLGGIFFFFYPQTAWAGCSKCKERGKALLMKERQEAKDVNGWDTDSTQWNSTRKSSKNLKGKTARPNGG